MHDGAPRGRGRLVGALGRVVDARPSEHRALGWAFAQFLLLLAAFYVVRPLRDEMGIASGVQNMQWLFSGTFVGIVIVVPIYGWAATKLGRRTLVPIVYVGLGITWIACFAAGYVLPEAAAPALAAFIFIWISVFNMLAISVFWSLLADLFTPEQGRRLFGFIAAGGTIGALLGPTLAATLVRVVAPGGLLLIAAALVVGAAVCARGLHAAASPATAQDAAPLGGSLWAGFRLMLSTPALRWVSLYILCMTWVNTIFYFEQAQIVSTTIGDSAARTSLFARMDLAVNLLALGVQALLTGRIIRRVGLTPVLVALPIVAGVALAVLAAVPMLAVLVVVQVARRSVNYALSKPAREIVFTPLRREAKYKGKNVVDTFVYRGGDAIAGWAFKGLTAAGLGLGAISWLALPIVGAWAWAARALGRDPAA